jgi:long-chain fatty acid transport protein
MKRKTDASQAGQSALRFVAAGLVAALVGLGATSARASGFLIYDLSGQAIGRASAVSADPNEPAAVWFNPAGLANMAGVGASAGNVFITARSRFSPASGGADTSSERGNFFLPNVFAHASLNDRVALGMGVYTAFGIGIRWPNQWEGREGAIAASLQTVAFNPTVAVKLHPQLSVAAGFDAIRGTVDFTNGLPAIVGGEVRLGGGAWAYGFNVALLYRPLPDRLQVGVTYRSRAKLSFDGQADFSPGNPDFDRMLPDQSGTAAITLPDIITVGVMGRPRPDLTLSFDANLVTWSTYDRIDIHFQSAPGRAIQPEGKNGVTLRVGADWAAPVPGLKLRAGFIFDQGAIPPTGMGPGLPDANRLNPTLGVGYGRGPLAADLGYMLIYFLDSKATSGREGPEGTYHTVAHLIGLTLRANWR